MNKKSSKPISLEPEKVSEILQEHREDAPLGWPEAQDKLAGAVGLSVLLVDGRQPPALVVSNNNSICQAFQSSPAHVGLCDPYCGDAHRRAMSAGSAVQYKCHAGLQCVTMPVQIGREQNLAVIAGRAFVSAVDYRTLVDRFRAGELNELLDKGPFENVVFAEPQRLDELPERVHKAVRKFGSATVNPPLSPATIEKPAVAETDSTPTAVEPTNDADLTPVAAEAQLASRRPQFDLQLEVDRLRGELEHRSHLVHSLQSFLARISSTNPEETYLAILTHSRELLKADRASLMVYDEGSNEIVLKASVGITADEGEVSRVSLGEGIAGQTLESGKPLVVENLDTAGFTQVPAGRSYKTKSFISYPIVVRGRRIGLLNFTDKTDGGSFNDVDLSLLEIIGPQIAVALERADWQERATQFQLMSITDPLTGLLNRRYLEERLTEELNRSSRYNYPMSCLMIDIDDFKKYNDRNGHQAGDVALKITAHSLKASLRSADVACRYGGEEFCVLLPQTSVSEAGVIAERMRQRVAETDYPFGKAQPMGNVSISIGISTLARNIDTAERVIAAADRALYHAKAEGKNRIEFYDGHLAGAFAGK
ncbi:MAG: diguanylate cyclase [Pyrinomonadaceae bacterium]|nr:diguanylate cyclase [Pyrinomonadaceae bacterium]